MKDIFYDYCCPICKNNNLLRTITRHVGGTVAECTICGHFCLWPELDDQSILALYESSALVSSKNIGSAIFDHQAYKLLKKSDPRKNLTVLDIGCGLGELLKKCSQNNHKVVGIEVTKSIVDQLNKEGFEVYNQTLSEFSQSKLQYDWVTCLDVIEHLKDPLSTIEAIAKLVKPFGRVVIQTPNGKAISKYGEKAYGLFVDKEHLHYYNPDQLVRIFTGLGFSLEFKKFYPASALSKEKILNSIDVKTSAIFTKPYRENNSSSGLRAMVEKLPPSIRGAIRSIAQIIRYISAFNDIYSGTAHGFILVLKRL